MTEEIWKVIPGFENYEVSSCGRIRNKETRYEIKPILSSSGYLTVRIRKNHGDYNKPAVNIHRAVA